MKKIWHLKPILTHIIIGFLDMIKKGEVSTLTRFLVVPLYKIKKNLALCGSAHLPRRALTI